ncbi:Uncharacterised protein [Actinobaculum suis]|uniref:Uncharacterized protein n=1 Tax=Actinobaculum suis TaxID=1657 RepID=A0A7Z8Y8G3_9ACTO|nr:hypothetical protein [Actinobaculum suis]VDG76159.1 Uncharacterised protein [Actinobaculum suis]
MREDAPTPEQVTGGRFWVEATFSSPDLVEHTFPVAGGVLVWQADHYPATRVAGLQIARPGDAEFPDWREVVSPDGATVRLEGICESAGGVSRWPAGEYLVTRVTEASAYLRVDAQDFGLRVVERKLGTPRPVAPSLPARNAMSAIFGIAGVDQIEWATDAGKGPVPEGFSIGTDLGKTLEELFDAWGLYARAGWNGGLRVADIPTGHEPGAGLVFTDGQAGTVVGAERAANRDDIFNHVVVPVADSEAVGEAYASTGKYAVDRFGWRTANVTGSSVASQAQALLVARSELAKYLRRARTVPVELVPDWRVEPYDLVMVQVGRDRFSGVVTGAEWPLAADATMVVDIGIESD